MALQQKKKLDWNDIASLFSSLNTERVEFEYKALSYPNPNSKKRTKTSESVEALVDGIEEMLSNDYVEEQAPNLKVSDIDIPQTKDRMKPDVFNQIRKKIETLQTLNFGYNGAGYDGSYNPGGGGDDDDCFSNSGFDYSRHNSDGNNGSYTECRWSGSSDGTVGWNSSGFNSSQSVRV